MTEPATETTPAPEFPVWPFSALDWSLKLMADYGRFAQGLNGSLEPSQVIRADITSSARLFNDMMAAYADLALAPMNAVLRVTTAEAPPKPPQES